MSRTTLDRRARTASESSLDSLDSPAERVSRRYLDATLANGRGGGRTVLLALALLLPLVVAAILLPPGLRVLPAIAAFLSGGALERYWQGLRERPLTLRETPALWRRQLHESVGVRNALVAAGAVAAAAALLLWPASGVRDAQPEGAAVLPGGHPAKLPAIKVLRRRAGAGFMVGGAEFRAFVAPEGLLAPEIGGR
jgi:hypothetical protein